MARLRPAGRLRKTSTVDQNTYSGLAARLHDAFWAADGEAAEMPRLAEFLRRHPGRALEIGCGSGRLLLPLLRQGHPVEGLDSSAEMLALCGEAAAELGLEPVLHHGDMAAFTSARRFGALAVPAFTLQLAGEPAAVLQHFARLLDPGGGLYFTVFLPLAELTGELPAGQWYPDHEIALPDGRRATVTTRHRFDRNRQILHRRHRYRLLDPGGRVLARHECRQQLAWFEPDQWLALLTAAGFTVGRAYGDFDPETPLEEGQILTFEAERTG
jgi:SAM-dependent methyltransferase